MIDSEQQIDLLDSFASKTSLTVAWPVFIKIDVGSKRAGMVNDSPSLPKLIQRIESSSSASVYGFYCHAGHSYACRTEDAAAAVLQTEVEGVVNAARFLVDGMSERKIVVSVGSTPTAHVIKRLQGVLPEGMDLELHAGMFERLLEGNKLTISSRKLPNKRPPASSNLPRRTDSTSSSNPSGCLQHLPRT
jgi:D-serine deaminase-like pyridoxal phosphate-dependent protein